MRLLKIDDEARAKVQQVIAWAKEHPYRGDFVPGDDPHFVAHLDSYRCVFTFTQHGGKIYRHLSVSVPSTKYPNPIAAFTIAELFGFTGFDQSNPSKPASDWDIDINDRDHCIVMAQRIRPETVQ